MLECWWGFRGDLDGRFGEKVEVEGMWGVDEASVADMVMLIAVNSEYTIVIF